MDRRALLVAGTGLITGLSGCSALVSAPNREDPREDPERADESEQLTLPEGEPVAESVVGDPREETDPHVVVVRNAIGRRTIEIRIHVGPDRSVVHADQYALARDEHVRIELHAPNEYAIELLEDGERVGQPVEIAGDWFEYECPATVIERREGERVTAVTSPDTEAC